MILDSPHPADPWQRWPGVYRESLWCPVYRVTGTEVSWASGVGVGGQLGLSQENQSCPFQAPEEMERGRTGRCFLRESKPSLVGMQAVFLRPPIAWWPLKEPEDKGFSFLSSPVYVHTPYTVSLSHFPCRPSWPGVSAQKPSGAFKPWGFVAFSLSCPMGTEQTLRSDMGKAEFSRAPKT